MIRFAIALTLFAQSAAALCSGDSFMDRLTDAERAQIAQAVSETPFPRGLIWTATKGRDTLTIVGTMHIYDKRLDEVHAAIGNATRDADVLLVEATAAEEAAMQAAFAADPEMLFVTDGPTLCYTAISRATSPRCGRRRACPATTSPDLIRRGVLPCLTSPRRFY